MTPFRIRRFADRDAPALARVFFRAVHIGARLDYSRRQRRAWAPRPPRTDWIRKRLNGQDVFVAVRHGRPVGFMTLRPDGYLDMAFVDPAVAGRGLAKRLYDAVLTAAKERGLGSLFTDASFPARRFFQAQGWSVRRARKTTRRGAVLINFRMERRPGGSPPPVTPPAGEYRSGQCPGEPSRPS